MDQQKRPSVYLVERCEELGRVLEFFRAPHSGQMMSLDERLVVFLAQIGFWEWELDNLVYAFTTFADRARAWENDSGPALAEGLRQAGLLVRAAAVKNLKAKRLARSERMRQVVAPVVALNRLVGVWNELLDACQERVLRSADERRQAVELGADVLPDLAKYRRHPLPVPADDGE